MKARRALACLAAVVSVVSCIDLGGIGPDEIGSIEFVPPSLPIVLLGDTLRDSLGAAEPLRARVYAGDGRLLEDSPVDFVTIDSIARVVEGNAVVATPDSVGRVRLFAVAANGLQSVVREVQIIPRADTMVATGARLDTVVHGLALDAPVDSTSAGLAVVLRTAANRGVPHMRVSYRLLRGGTPVTDTAVVALVTEGGRPSVVDTTDANGTASRRLRVRVRPGEVITDSLTIEVHARLLGSPLAGSPIIFTVLIRPPQ